MYGSTFFHLFNPQRMRQITLTFNAVSKHFTKSICNEHTVTPFFVKNLVLWFAVGPCRFLSKNFMHILYFFMKPDNRPFSYSEKNRNRKIFYYILSNIRIWTILVEALMPLNRASCIKCIQITLDPVSFAE